jgi:hypothetical protein
VSRPSALSVADGVRAAADLVLARPARLGSVRLIAIDGPSGSGKTTTAAVLSRAIAGNLGGRVVRPARTNGLMSEGTSRADAEQPETEQEPATVVVVSTDLLATWEEPLSWWSVLEEHLLIPLAAGRTSRLPVVQWISGHPRPGGAITVPPVDVLVLEGVSSGRAAVADRLSALVWVEVPDPVERLERAVARDGEESRRFLVRWQTQEADHFAADRTRARADLVIRP